MGGGGEGERGDRFRVCEKRRIDHHFSYERHCTETLRRKMLRHQLLALAVSLMQSMPRREVKKTAARRRIRVTGEYAR